MLSLTYAALKQGKSITNQLQPGSAGEVDLYLGNQVKLVVFWLYNSMLCELYFFLTLWLRRRDHLSCVRHGLCRRESDFFTCWM